MPETSDSEITPQREAIRVLYQRLGIVPTASCADFGCRWLPECRNSTSAIGEPFHTGGWPYVGSEYGCARVRGVEAKILIVGMDIGGNERADKERFEEAQSRWRRYTVDPKNAHMGGLRLIMKQFAPEVNAALRSRQFAFTNTVKCVTESPSKRTKATDVMIEHCADHLREEICLLEPDLIVTQGEYPAWAVRHKVLMSSQSVGIFRGTPRGVAEVLNGLVGSRRTVVLTTPHPAYALTGFRWRRQEIPHFLEEAFEKARDELVNLLGSRT